MKKVTLKIILCFVAGIVMAQDIPADTSATETPVLIEFRRQIYLDGWEIKYENLNRQRSYIRPWKINRHEVRSIMMEDSPELLLYERGRRHRNLGNSLIYIGIPITLTGIGAPLGGAMLGTGAFFRANGEHRLRDATNMHNSRINQMHSLGSELDHFVNRGKVIRYQNIASMSFFASGALLLPGIYLIASNDGNRRRLAGGIICVVNSVGLAVNGFMFLSASRAYFQKVVEFNNSNTTLELNLGFTENGLGFRAKF